LHLLIDLSFSYARLSFYYLHLLSQGLQVFLQSLAICAQCSYLAARLCELVGKFPDLGLKKLFPFFQTFDCMSVNHNDLILLINFILLTSNRLL
jgi:hypothetical protein